MGNKRGEVVRRETQVDIANPSEVLEFAKDINDIVVKGRLYDTIQGKNYVNVEGWQLAGALIGYTPILKELKNLSDDKQIKYRAEVELVKTSDGQVVGRGVAICSSAEAKKRDFDEFAIASMAQTRAVGKAYRLCIGWLLKLAGYEPTPSEEMPSASRTKAPVQAVNHTPGKPSTAPAEAVDASTEDAEEVAGEVVDVEPEVLSPEEEAAIELIKSCRTKAALRNLWVSDQFKAVRSSAAVQKAKDWRKTSIEAEMEEK